jgi:hypothetical protein
MLGIPREAHLNGSLLLGGAPLAGIVSAIVAILVSLVIGSLIASFVEREAGLFCCCLGLAALAVRCGPMRPVLQYAGSPTAFLALATEAAILAVTLIAGWIGLQKVLARTLSRRDGVMHPAPKELVDATLQQKCSTLGVQMLVMAVVEMIFIQTDAKAQAMAGVFVAGYLGSLAAYMFTPLAEGIWYWTGPLAVALIGYLAAYFSADGPSMSIGEMHGWAAALARATPLDYAGMGTTGALLGYWSSRRWANPPEEGEEAASG